MLKYEHVNVAVSRTNILNDINITFFIISPYIEEHINIVKKAFTEGNNIPASTLAQNICKEIKDKYGNYKTYVVPFI